MRGFPAAVALVLVVVLAGCAGLMGSNATPTATADCGMGTSVSTPEQSKESPSGSSGNDGYPPGLSEDGLESATRLIGVHTRILTSRDFTVEYNVFQNRSRYVASQNVTTRVDLSDGWRGVSTQRVTASGTLPRGVPRSNRRATWRNGTDVYRMSVRNGTRTFTDVSLLNASLTTNFVTGRTIFRDMLDPANESSVTTVILDGTTRYRLNATVTGERRNVTWTAVVTPSGLIERFELELVTSPPRRESTDRTTLGITFCNVGSTTVSRPDWVSTAVNRTRGG